jgi:myo-inositol-1(or 4)-monophosphatase
MKIQSAELVRLLRGLPPIARQKLNEVIEAGDAFDNVGIGADKAATTRIDRELESVCIDYLSVSGIVASVLSEEIGAIKISETGLQAVLDPLDGTTNAKMGFPYYALSLALLYEGEAVAGLVFNYASGDVFLGVKREGATRNGQPISVSKKSDLRHSCIVSSRPLSDMEVPMYGQMMRDSKRIRISSSPALDIAHVACGTFDAYVDYHAPCGLIHLHDVIAAKLILEEAGGRLLDDSGPMRLPETVHETFNVFAVNDVALYQEVKRYFHA